MHRVIAEIIEENKWRTNEFARLKVNSLEGDNLWFRMCIPMIYAHWEGFVVSSLGILLEYLNTLELKPIEVPTNLIVIGLNDSYQSLSGKQSFNQRIEFTNRFNEVFNKPLHFKKRVDTNSNLKSKVLEGICEKFGFDFSKFRSYSADIDRLVSVRNSIAHGENSVIPDFDNIEKYIHAVNELMDVLCTEIEIFLAHEKFKINPPRTA